MATEEQASTSATLLGQLRTEPTNQQAWAQFVARYGRQIFRWCRRWGCQESDAEDVTQNVLLELARQMRTFEYDKEGSFRGWLRTVAYRAWCKFVEAKQRIGVGTGSNEVIELLHSVPAGENLVEFLNAECERELLEIAEKRVQLRVQPNTWRAFQLTAVEDKSGAEVAAELGMQVGAVFVARARVQKLLQEEIAKLENPSS